MMPIQLIALLMVLSIVRSFIPFGNKFLSFSASLFLAIFYTIQLSSVIVTGEIADYRFYENFNFGDALSVVDFFGREGLLIVGALLLLVPLIHWLGYLLRVKLRKKILLFFGLFFGLGILSLSGGILNNAYSTINLKFAGESSFVEALDALQIDPKQYIGKNQIKATKGKNIIVLSLESLEKGYLEGNLKALTPNLSDMAAKNVFYTMRQGPAGGWTSASMYTAITGVPAFFGTHGNSVFQNSYENKLTSLADVLKTAGYDLQYFVGKKEFSGIDDMLKTHGFTVKSEKDFKTAYEKVDWGIQDMDLFAELKKELLIKKEDATPFAFFLSTISTHFPNGVPDRRVDSILPAQRSRLELMVSATDHYIGDLIQFLKKEDMLSNTVFFIYPDHLLMGNKSPVIADFEERSLYLITNADNTRSNFPLNRDIYQIDLPKIILDGAEISHNAKFLTDFIANGDKNAFLNQNDKNLLRLNDAALKTLNCKEGIYISLNQAEGQFEIRNKQDMVLLTTTLPKRGSCQRVLFDENLRPYEDFPIATTEVLKSPKAFMYLDVYQTNGLLYGTLNDTYHFGITRNNVKEVVFRPADIDLLKNINLNEDKKNFIVLESNSWNVKKPSSFVINGKENIISRGLTVISFNSKTGYEFRTFDTYGSLEETEELMKILKQIRTNNSPFVILAHDSAAKNLALFSEDLSEMGFDQLSRLQERQAYLAYHLEGNTLELVDDNSIKKDLPFPNDPKNDISYFKPSKIGFISSADRFIAHAGGMIDGVKYTDSKEAMDFSYAQGFRLFELDILETSDHEYVAAHDWVHWKKEVRFSGETPVSRAEFLKHKIRGKYSTLDMDGINSWFSAHPDAILVTDKVNDPEKFASKFVDKDRLMMELFTLDAVEKAISLGVMPLVSESAIAEIKKDMVTYLLNNKIGHLALSRRGIENKTTLLKRLRENGIKVYVYHVNFDPGKDEKYVFENEIGLVYGMYADQWISEFSTIKD